MAVLGLCFCARAFSSCGKRGGHSSSRCVGLSLLRPLLLRSTGSRCAGSVIVAHGPSCLAACGTFPDQSSNPCPLHWQADSQPLHHQGSPVISFIHISVYMSTPIAQFIPPPPPPPCHFPPLVSIRLFSISVSQFLPCKLVHLYHFSKFHIYALIYHICFSLSGLHHSV